MRAVVLALRSMAVAVFLLAAGLAIADVPVPALQARVTDLTGTLSPAQQSRLEQALMEFEARKGSQIAVLIIPTTQPEAIEQYAMRVAETWKLGRKGIDDGVLLLVAKEDRALRIEVGYGLEGVIPDAVAKRVISEIIIPYFKQNDYFGGIEAGVSRLIRLIDGEPLPPPVEKDVSWSGFEDFLPLGFLLVLVGAGLFRMIFGRLLGASIVGGLVGILFWLIVGSLLGALIAGLFAFLFSLGGMRSGGFWPGGGGFGGGFGRGGGFGGGGGGFGGGGASGRW
ncbi:TPM domain-containing protein [Methylobacter luteus]|uniref:TPM domain-containing protein n=1 Tax=Methylobacter luteus TaxID=415 RepID=UPI0004809B99|nr:YgcG family protein [Methylobacter luteus]